MFLYLYLNNVCSCVRFFMAFWRPMQPRRQRSVSSVLTSEASQQLAIHTTQPPIYSTNTNTLCRHNAMPLLDSFISFISFIEVTASCSNFTNLFMLIFHKFLQGSHFSLGSLVVKAHQFHSGLTSLIMSYSLTRLTSINKANFIKLTSFTMGSLVCLVS